MSRQEEYLLISGKTKPEFGNKDHIKVLEKYSKLTLEFKEGKCLDELNLTSRITISFNCCKCGNDIEADFDADNSRYIGDKEVVSEMGIDTIKCCQCNQAYKSNGELVFLAK